MKYKDFKVGETYIYDGHDEEKVLHIIHQQKRIVTMNLQGDVWVFEEEHFKDFKPLKEELPEEGLLVSKFGSLVYKLSDGSGYGFGYGNQSDYFFNKLWEFSIDDYWRKATPEQEKKFVEMIKKECENRGLFEDTKIEAHANGTPLRNPDYMGVEPIFDLTTGYNRNGVIFHRGKFATPQKETTTTPQVGKQYTHKKGNTYTVTGFTNDLGDREDKDFPVTVVYVDQEGRRWSRPLSKWHGSFELKE